MKSLQKNMIFLAIGLLCLTSCFGQLPGYNVDLYETTVSGVSAGAFMAAQLQVAYSSIIKASAVLAGGPPLCTMGNVASAVVCIGAGQSEVNKLVGKSMEQAQKNLIDPVSNLQGKNIFLFRGTLDTVVNPGIIKSAEKYFSILGANTITEYSIPAEHSYITLKKALKCPYLGEPFFCQCKGYDTAYHTLENAYGNIKPAVPAIDTNLKRFTQSYYTQDGFSMGNEGYYYVPTSCQNGEKCRVHISLHGCLQTLADIGTKYITLTGLNDYAEANNIIMLYPQIRKSLLAPLNPMGCWDWWGYTDDVPFSLKYVTKEGKQMNAIYRMLMDLATPPTTTVEI